MPVLIKIHFIFTYIYNFPVRIFHFYSLVSEIRVLDQTNFRFYYVLQYIYVFINI